jgi:hypothetical protein
MVADAYGEVTRTYHIIAELHPEEGDDPAFVEVIAAHPYAKPSPDLGDNPCTVDLLGDLSDDTVKELTRIAKEHAPEPEAVESQADRDIDARRESAIERTAARVHPVFSGAVLALDRTWAREKAEQYRDMPEADKRVTLGAGQAYGDPARAEEIRHGSDD